MLSSLKRFAENILSDLFAQGFAKWLIGSAAMTVLFAVWEWLQARSPLEILALVAFVMLMVVAILELLAKRRIRRGHAFEERPPRTRESSDSLQQPWIKFFPDRDALDKYRDFNGALGKCEAIDAVFVTARKLIANDYSNTQKIKRVILPDPDGESFIQFAKSLKDYPNLANYVKAATAELKEKYGIEVRWFPNMIGYSMLIADASKATGWVHAEMVMPFSKANRRPSVTIYKRGYENTVTTFAKIFEDMWNASNQPGVAAAKPLPPSMQGKSASPVHTKEEPPQSADPADRLIPIREAAILAYELTRGSKAALMAERDGNKNPEPILYYYANALVRNSGGIALFGARPPSRQIEEIPSGAIPSYSFSDDLTAVTQSGAFGTKYENLQVREKDVISRASVIKGWG